MRNFFSILLKLKKKIFVYCGTDFEIFNSNYVCDVIEAIKKYENI